MQYEIQLLDQTPQKNYSLLQFFCNPNDILKTLGVSTYLALDGMF